MTTTPPSSVTFAPAAAMLAEHLADHGVPEPVSLTVTTSYGHSTATAQLRANAVPDLAADLIAWADTLGVLKVEAWRPPELDRVHLSIQGTLTGSTGAVELKVFGSVDYDPLRFVDLQADRYQGMSLSLEQLRSWTANPSPSTDSAALDAHRANR